MRSILAPLNGTAWDKLVLHNSLLLAQLDAGHIEALRVSPDPAAFVAQAAQFDIGTSVLVADTLRNMERNAKEARTLAHKAYLDFCESEHVAEVQEPNGATQPSAAWRETVGDELDEVVKRSRFHDVVVLAGGRNRPGRPSREELGSIIVSSGRPVLLVPENTRKTLTDTVAIAWKNVPEAARAVTAAMPLLAKARRIHVLSANEEERKAIECLECADSVVQQLRWHRLKVDGHFVIPAGRTVPDAILETAHSIDADLLVMGAYGHSRMREFIFGGFTERVLQGANLPVLLFR